MENTGKIWINKDEWDLNKAWEKWRFNTINIPLEQAKTHPLYKEVEVILNRINK
jgi:hypothetical protein